MSYSYSRQGDRPPLELAELEPSPVDESPSPSYKEYFPPPKRSSTLGLSGHTAPYYLLRAHRYSSYIFTAFTAAHITNTALIPLLTRSIPESTRYLLLTRPYYQSWPLAEPLLVISPLIVHVATGIALRLHRRRAAVARSGAETSDERRGVAWPKLSGTSALGYLAVPLVVGHSALNRGLPVVVEGGSSGVGMDFVGHGVALSRVLGYAGYAALVGVAGWHVVWGWGRWLGLAPDQVVQMGAEGNLRRKRRWWGINALSAVVVATWMSGGIGILARGGKVGGWVGRAYDEMYRKVPILGHWV